MVFKKNGEEGKEEEKTDLPAEEGAGDAELAEASTFYQGSYKGPVSRTGPLVSFLTMTLLFVMKGCDPQKADPRGDIGRGRKDQEKVRLVHQQILQAEDAQGSL